MRIFDFALLFFGRLLLILFFLGGVDDVTAEPRCDSCKLKAENACVQYCARTLDPVRKKACLQRCQQKSCLGPCSRTVSQASEKLKRPDLIAADPEDLSLKGGAKECAKCLKEQRHNYCRETCISMKPESLPNCMDRCAKQQCARECLLPGNPAAKERRVLRMDCGTCRRNMTHRCAEDCGEKDSAGYTTCRVSCVEDACLEECNPQLFSE